MRVDGRTCNRWPAQPSDGTHQRTKGIPTWMPSGRGSGKWDTYHHDAGVEVPIATIFIDRRNHRILKSSRARNEPAGCQTGDFSSWHTRYERDTHRQEPWYAKTGTNKETPR
eukprot:1004109-Prorocentrum_minimum.AAC.2